ncbi:EmrB/QacA family drug resistance transporter [Capsulimonas corticalis]|uniref:EmrB/QacA family drug resistance transporter n=1 Tax=Capsulimonas corticalis TaxID=2219043 RepID=A0A402D3D3_9BACT|nr:DHA2 family efflux MFS transporter permease subunit [Capsulimonas corticalis]BDI28550.1 EmrB/QacA family drug resistance transporter [Capsulimonas corticalis]
MQDSPALPSSGRGKLGRAHDAADAAATNLRYRWLILIGLIVAAAMEVLDTTIVNVAQAQMAGNLGATTQDIAWVSTGYILANVVVLPMTAFLTARFGRKNYLTASIMIFTVASFFCGASHSLGEIVVWRILQGAAGAALISTAQATLVQVFPPEEQSIVQPLFLMGLVVAPTVGPSLGGWLTDAASWHWCFFINIPLGAIAGFIVFAFLHDTEASRGDEPVDWAGVGLLTVGLGTLQYVLEEGERNDWFADPTIFKLSVISAVSLIALIIWQLSPRNTHPVMNLRVLKNSSLTAGIILFVSVGFGLYGVSYMYPLLAQTVQGMTAYQTGMAMLPGGIATAFSIVFCGVISNDPKSKIDARALTLLGIGFSVTAMWLFMHLNSQSSVGDTFWPLLIRGVSIGFLFVPVNTLAIGNLKPAEVNQGVGLLGLARQLGGSIGIAVLATYLNSQIHVNRAHLVNNITVDNAAFNDRMSGLQGLLASQGYSAPAAYQGALHIIDQTLMREAIMLSYNHTFLFIMFVSIATIPTLLLLRKPKPGTAPAAMH